MTQIEKTIKKYLDNAESYLRPYGPHYVASEVLECVDKMLRTRPEVKQGTTHNELRVRHAELMVKCWQRILESERLWLEEAKRMLEEE